jgi:hypothetical protein
VFEDRNLYNLNTQRAFAIRRRGLPYPEAEAFGSQKLLFQARDAALGQLGWCT